jgi:hypothetical protein
MAIKKQDDGETVYVLSTDDVERIAETFELAQSFFWELLWSRKVDFPNSFHSKARQRSDEGRDF